MVSAGMRKWCLIVSAILIPCLAIIAADKWLEAKSNDTLLEAMRRIRPHATMAEVTQLLGRPMYTMEAPNFPDWMKRTAVGGVDRGTVCGYSISGFHPTMVIVHFLPESGVQFVTWYPE